MDLRGGTPYPLALGLTPSLINAYMDSPVLKQHGKAQEAEQKTAAAVIGRIDVVIKALAALGKAMAGRR